MLEILAPQPCTLHPTTKCPSRIIRCSFLEPFARDWSYFAVVYRQKMTKASKIDFLLMFEWTSVAPPTPQVPGNISDARGLLACQIPASASLYKKCSFEQRLTFDNPSLEVRLTFGGPFQESSVVGGGQAFSTDLYQRVIVQKCARALFAATDRGGGRLEGVQGVGLHAHVARAD